MSIDIEWFMTLIRKENDSINRIHLESKAKIDTYTEFINETEDEKTKTKLEKKREDLTLKNDIEIRIHQKTREEYQKQLLEAQKELHKPKKINLSEIMSKTTRQQPKMQVIVDMIQMMEGSDRIPVPQSRLDEELMNLLMYSKQDIAKMLLRLLKEGIIYESKPSSYNTV